MTRRAGQRPIPHPVQPPAQRRGQPASGALPIVRVGSLGFTTRDVYARLLRARWRALLGYLAAGYLAVNVVFAGLYLVAGHLVHGTVIAGARPGRFADAFAFSVQTVSTIGYGGLAPAGHLGNALAALEAFVGLVSFALVAGVVFAKFARPSAGLLFSDKVVVAPRDGVPCLMLRIANARGSEVVEARVRVTVLLREQTAEGHQLTRLHDLELMRDTTPLLIMSWLVIHPIDADSPLHGLTAADFEREKVRLVVSLTGLDGLFHQTTYAYAQYGAEAIHFDHDFEDMMSRLDDGRMQLDLSRFHEVRPVPAAAADPEDMSAPAP